MIHSLFTTCSQIIYIYSSLCLIRIILTWIPQAAYSPIGQILASICDPYLNWFKRFPFTRIGMIDFSPILALGVLSIASQLCSNIIATGHFSPWMLVIGIVNLLWSFIGFLCNLLLIFLIIRLLYDIFSSTSNSQFWYNLDRFLNPVISKATGFIPHKNISYRMRLIITILAVIALRIGLGILIGSLFTGFLRFNMI